MVRGRWPPGRHFGQSGRDERFGTRSQAPRRFPGD
jgi:hypothetical protein